MKNWKGLIGCINILLIINNIRRNGSFLNPFCHLVIKAVRVDSPPCRNSTQSLAELLTKYRVKMSLARENLAAKLGASLGTLKNWECCRTKPNRQFWSKIRELEEGRH
jgi:DNA-binding XRE family transcriptional regulator